MFNNKFNFALLALSSLLVQNVFALEVDREVMPRITLGGRTIVTADNYGYLKGAVTNKKDTINTDDSALILRFDKHMYGVESGVAGAVIGFREVSNSVIFHQLNAFYWNKNIEFRMGKSKLRNTIIEFPTLRNEDLVDYTHVNTASSDEEFDQVYGDIISFDWYFSGSNQSIGTWAGTRKNDTTNTGAPDGYDTKGFNYQYKPSEDLQYLKRIRHAGILVDSQKVQTATGEKWMQAVIAGVELNLNINPTSSWSLGLQTISNNGLDGANGLSSISSRAKIKSSAQVLSLRYTRRPLLLTRWQVGLSVASKKYDNITNAKNTSIIANFSYRLGQGVNLMTQIKQTDYSNAINNGNDEMVIQAGISFQFDAVFNNSIGERNSILNLEHGYLQ